MKNGFTELNQAFTAMELNKLNYADVKINVLVSNQLGSIVGEVQFLLGMLGVNY